MAIDFAKVTGAIAEYAPQYFAKAITRYTQVFERLKKVGPSSPQGPRWKVQSAGHAGAVAFAEGANDPAADEFEYANAALSWGQYHAKITLGGLSRDVLAVANEEFILGYVEEQMAEAFREMVSRIDTHLRGGVNANGIVGIVAAIDDANTYAGLDRTSVTSFACYINDNGGTPRALSMALMDTVHRQFVDVIGGNYTEIWTSLAQAQALTALSSGNGVAAVQINVQNGAQTMTKTIGFGGPNPLTPHAYYNGRPVYAIPGYPSGRIDFVDPEGLELEVLRQPYVEHRAKTNDDESWVVYWKGQLKFKNPRFQAASLQDLS